MKNIVNLKPVSSVLALTVLFTVASCASRTDLESNLGIDGAPDWVNEGANIVDDDGGHLLQGIGMAEQMGDFSLQKSVADNRARAELARIMSSAVSSSIKEQVASDGDSATKDIERDITTISNASLNGAKIIARWKNPENGDIYSFAELDLDKVDELINVSSNINPDHKAFFKRVLENNSVIEKNILVK